MRNFINTVTEAKLAATGIYTAPTARDLLRMVQQHDVRGCAVDGEVFIWNAYDETHHNARMAVGVEELYGEDGNGPENGFDFYAYLDGTEGHDDPVNRDEWDGEPDFVVNGVWIRTSTSKALALFNKQFARMVSPIS